ncbi:MAG: 3-oxoadipate enol-lactonase [Vulcanimicrobiaceae bacterium]
MIRTKRLTAPDGVATGVRYAGLAGAHVIFVHGVGSTAAIWDRQIEALCLRYRCAAVELRGNGVALPDPDPAHITREGYVRDVLAAADEAGADRFHLVGCSLGGVIGFELWQTAPQRIASLTLVASFAAYPNAVDTVRNITAAAMQAPDMRTFAESRAARLLPPNARAERHAETVEQMAAKSRRSYVAATHATWTGDYRGLLKNVTVPALVICGELDQIAPPGLSQEMAAHIPGARFVQIAGAAHVANADRPHEFNVELRSFLEQTAPDD